LITAGGLAAGCDRVTEPSGAVDVPEEPSTEIIVSNESETSTRTFAEFLHSPITDRSEFQLDRLESELMPRKPEVLTNDQFAAGLPDVRVDHKILDMGPDPEVDHKILVLGPDTNIDHKILHIGPAPPVESKILTR
jgi:hypothetical protein